MSPVERSWRVPVRAPFAVDSLLHFLAVHAVPGIERVDGGTYRRTLGLAHGPAVLAVTPGPDHLAVTARLSDPRDGEAARVAGVLVADAYAFEGYDPAEQDAALAADPVLAPLVASRPGLRMPGHPDAAELAARTVIGQQVSVAGARTLMARLVAARGGTLPAVLVDAGGPDRLWPPAEALAAVGPGDLAGPRSRSRALAALGAAVADGTLDLSPQADPETARRGLLALPGVGPWTVGYVAMRILGDADVFLPTDLAVRRAVERLGMDGRVASVAAAAEAWRPWRSLALLHLWSTVLEARRAPA
jgi:AraC family transcriptional regulator of adaptative response / DNA-3-methyladenine glycosylase II